MEEIRDNLENGKEDSLKQAREMLEDPGKLMKYLTGMEWQISQVLERLRSLQEACETREAAAPASETPEDPAKLMETIAGMERRIAELSKQLHGLQEVQRASPAVWSLCKGPVQAAERMAARLGERIRRTAEQIAGKAGRGLLTALEATGIRGALLQIKGGLEQTGASLDEALASLHNAQERFRDARSNPALRAFTGRDARAMQDAARRLKMAHRTVDRLDRLAGSAVNCVNRLEKAAMSMPGGQPEPEAAPDRTDMPEHTPEAAAVTESTRAAEPPQAEKSGGPEQAVQDPAPQRPEAAKAVEASTEKARRPVRESAAKEPEETPEKKPARTSTRKKLEAAQKAAAETADRAVKPPARTAEAAR